MSNARPPTRAAPALVVATRGAERRGRPHCGPSPQRWPEEEGGGEARKAGGRGARGERRPTGTDDTSPGGRGQHHCLWLLGRRVCGPELLGSRAVWCRRWSRQLWRPRRRRRSTLLLCPSSWRGRWRRSSRRKRRLRSRRRWRSWGRRWLRLKTGFWSSFSGEREEGTRVARQTWSTLSRVEQLGRAPVPGQGQGGGEEG